MKIKFLVAEEIRPEIGGKLTILGLFPDDVILIAKENLSEGISQDLPRGFERLAFLISISGLTQKRYKYRGRIIDPSGGVCKPESPLGEGYGEKGMSRSIIIEMKPFIVKNMGVYNFHFYVNKKEFIFPFEIREQATPES